MTDLPERKELRERIAAVTTKEGLKFRDIEAVLDVVVQSGANVFYPISDEALGDKLHMISSRRRDLVDGPTASASAFADWARVHAPDYGKVTTAPERKIAIGLAYEKFKTSGPQLTPDEFMLKGLLAKDSAKLTPIEKIQIADLQGKQRNRGYSYNGRSTV